MSTKVLLWQTIDKLGKRGDQVTVSDGYARNYLYPRRLATPATEGAAREFKAAARKAEKVEQEIKKQFSALAQQVAGAHVKIEMLANAEGHLFGSVTPSMIADALKRDGMDVNAKFVLIETPIRNLGEFSATARFHPEVQAKLKVTVVPSKAEAVKEGETDEENPFTKGISVDEAERGDPRKRGGKKRPRQDKEGKKEEGGAAKAGGEKAAEKPAEKAEKPAEKPAKAEKKKE